MGQFQLARPGQPFAARPTRRRMVDRWELASLNWPNASRRDARPPTETLPSSSGAARLPLRPPTVADTRACSSNILVNDRYPTGNYPKGQRLRYQTNSSSESRAGSGASPSPIITSRVHGLGHYGSDNITETASNRKVSVNLAPSQLTSDNFIATGQLHPPVL